MKRYLVILLIIAFLVPGCSGLKKQISQLDHGLSQKKILELWSEPTEKVHAGTTRSGYAVVLWIYIEKANETVLIFVDGELYNWIVNDPEAVFKELQNLDIQSADASRFGLMQYQKSLQDSANEAIKTQRTMDIIRSYQNHKTIQMQMQTQQIMQTIRQQQMRQPPPAPPPPPPARPHRQNH